MAYDSILCISDQHEPFSHRDHIPFLKEIKKKYKPDLVVNMGDEVDSHYMSFHDHDPDGGMSPSSELESAVAGVQQLHRLFEKMLVCDSNHGSLVFRKAKHYGLPRAVFRDWKDVLMTPKWEWRSQWIVNDNILFHHGKSPTFGKLMLATGMNTVESHFHTKQGVLFHRAPILRWSMKLGCVIDNEKFAFAYNKNNIDDIALGHGIILRGIPRVLPMELNRHARWTGWVP